MDTPFHALVPHGPTREPGLIIISPHGQIRFWDGLGMGLAGGDNFAHFVLDLEEGETMTTLTRSDVRPELILAWTQLLTNPISHAPILPQLPLVNSGVSL